LQIKPSALPSPRRRPQFHSNFIAHIEKNLSPLHVVLISATVCAQHCPTRPFIVSELERAIAFLTPLRARSPELGAAAALVLDAEVALLQVRAAAAVNSVAGLDAMKVAIRKNAASLAALREGEDTVVAASVHRTAAEYYKIRGPASSFYASALLFLGSSACARTAAAGRRRDE
jgi:hypothetical protein